MPRTYRVVVRAHPNPPFMATVEAADEWKARTRAMVRYPHPLRGQPVEYYVREVK